MEETFTSFRTAKLAKEKGFNIPISTFFNNEKTPRVTTACAYRSDRDDISNWNNGAGSYPTLARDVLCSAPTLSLLQKWLREAKGVNINPPYYFSNKGYACIIFYASKQIFFKTYDEALENELYIKLQQL